MRKHSRKLLPVLLFLLGIQIFISLDPIVVSASDHGRIHFLTVEDDCLCVLVECNGQFGMIDSGDDSSYPDGSDPRYPARPGITKDTHYEDEVISYMKSQGVTSDNFEFYIGTHSHSDHIGSADQIIYTFHPKRVYTQEYKDSYISDSNGLWDNLYNYDKMLEAAKNVGASIILNYDPHAPVYPEQISLSGSIIWDDNENAAGTRPESMWISLSDPVTGQMTPLEIYPDETDQWSFTFGPLPKFDDGRNPVDYSVSLYPPEGYRVFQQENNVFLCIQDLSIPQQRDSAPPSADTYSSEESYVPAAQDMFLPSSVIQTDTAVPLSSIPATDRVTFSRATFTVPGEPAILSSRQVGRFDTITQEQNTVASPDFLLGGSMKISIKNYGGDFQTNPKPDANYFSLGVLVESNGQSAFIAGDINNFEGNETRLAQELGHVDLLCLGHHGYYGSNTYTYLNTLSPHVMVLPGDYTGVGNITGSYNDGIGTLDTLLEMGRNNVPLYPTVLYHDLLPALTFEFDSALSSNIPSGSVFIGVSQAPDPPVRIFYKDGIPTPYTGWYSCPKGTYYFDNSIYAAVDKWLDMPDGSRYHFDRNGEYTSSDWEKIDGIYYYFDPSGSLFTGWVPSGKYWYYANGVQGMVTSGWNWINGSCYYFYPSGLMAADTWVDNFYVDTSGAWIPNAQSHPQWCLSDGRWWYRHADGSYTRSGWEKINGLWYYFDAEGWMYTGWIGLNGQWYYLNPDGSMMTQGWHWIDNQCYYMDASGVMAANTWVDDFYVNASGAWVPDATHSHEWRQSAGKWWYRHFDGSYTRSGWEKINGLWYYFDTEGWMCTGWIALEGQWYYLNPDGSMAAQGWHWINNQCYYMDASGAMAANTWVGDFYVNASGAWVPDATHSHEWRQSAGKWWYRHFDGSYTRSGWEKINGLWYYFDAEGWMCTGWIALEDQWYYLNPDGSMAAQGWHWIDNNYYYMDASGAMAADTWIDGCYVNASGAWVSFT